MPTAIGVGIGVPFGGFMEAFLKKFPGASAAYSLRKLATAPTDVVRVRRSSDNTEQDFSANEVKGSGLLDFVVPTDVQAKYNNAMYFDGVDDYVAVDSLAAAVNSKTKGRVTVGFIYQSTGVLQQVWGANDLSDNTSDLFLRVQTNNLLQFGVRENGVLSLLWTSSTALSDNTLYIVDVDMSDSGSTFTINGVQDVGTYSTGNASTVTWFANVNDLDVFSIGCNRDTGAPAGQFFFKGLIDNFYVYDEDGTSLISSYNGYGNTDADWTDQIGSNDGTVNGTPALFTGQGFNAYVSTWYDQNVPTSKQRMYFDRVDDYISVPGMTAAADYFGACTISAKVYVSNTASTQVVWALGSDGYRLWMQSGNWKIGTNTDTGVAITSGSHDVSVAYSASGSGISFTLDGVEVWTGSASGAGVSNVFYIGARDNGGVALPFEGTIYDFALTGSSVKNFSFNGYGNTDLDWRDQTGGNNGTVNGSPNRCLVDLTLAKDAIQETTANQPQIVEDGAVITSNGKPALNFNGTTHRLVTSDYIGEMTQNDMQVSMVMDPDNATAFYALVEADITSPSYSSLWFMPDTSGGGVGWVNGTSIGTDDGANQQVIGLEKTGNTGTAPFDVDVQGYLNGATSGSQESVGLTENEVLDATFIGSNGAESSFFSGTIQEVVAYKNTDNGMAEMQSNQTKHYGLYVPL